MKEIFLILISVCLLSSCKKTTTDNSNAVAAPNLYEYLIAPSATNANITLYNSNHYVSVDTRTTLKNKLFVFLPGTTGSPEFYKLIVKKAAALGYHAIGLMYPNGGEMYTAASTNTDNTLFGRCRQETFDGSDQTLVLSVNSNNCIKGRLNKLLVYLKQKYPSLNFGQFINGSDVTWSKVTLAGHSQGGGHAFYIAKKVAVEKAISFASMDWNTLLGKSADWVKQAGLTPVTKYYSVNSINDELFGYANVQTQLNDLGMSGSSVSLDNNSAPYSGSRKLSTAAIPAISVIAPNHNVSCLDQYVPKDAQGAVISSFNNAWTYLITN